MSKTIKFEKSINEIVEFDLNEQERIDLIKYMLYDLSTNNGEPYNGKEFFSFTIQKKNKLKAGEESQNAGTVQKTKEELRHLNLEHPSYWENGY
jgi:hypothetical protein